MHQQPQAARAGLHELREQQHLLPIALPEPIHRRQPGHGDWIAGTLQFTEQTALFNALNFSVDMLSSNTYGGYANSTVALLNVGVLQCPSESRNQGLYPFLATGQYYGLGNYVGNYGGPGPISLLSGTIIPSNNNLFGSAPLPGTTTLWPNSYGNVTWGPVRIASITDGTSNTGLVSERLIGIPYPYPASTAALGAANFNRCSIHNGITTSGLNTGPAGALLMYQSCAQSFHVHPLLRQCRAVARGRTELVDVAVVQPLRHAQPDQLHE